MNAKGDFLPTAMQWLVLVYSGSAEESFEEHGAPLSKAEEM